MGLSRSSKSISGQSRHNAGTKKLVLTAVQWTRSVEASITPVASRAPPEPATRTWPSGDNCGILRRGAWVSPSALARDVVMLHPPARAAITSETPTVLSGHGRRGVFVAVNVAGSGFEADCRLR